MKALCLVSSAVTLKNDLLCLAQNSWFHFCVSSRRSLYCFSLSVSFGGMYNLRGRNLESGSGGPMASVFRCAGGLDGIFRFMQFWIRQTDRHSDSNNHTIPLSNHDNLLVQQSAQKNRCKTFLKRKKNSGKKYGPGPFHVTCVTVWTLFFL